MTPLMAQYWEIKNQHPDKIVLFRMGDFFEMFHTDAETAAPILGIALTARNRKANDETKMCGVPHHSIAGPIAKLLAAGHKVAICDQIEDPATAKGLVKRAVTRVLTPGLVYDPTTLDQVSGHFLSAYDTQTVAFLDPTTGEAFFYRSRRDGDRQTLWRLLCPRELILTADQRRELNLNGDDWTMHLTVVDDQRDARERLVQYAAQMQGQDILSTLAPWQERNLERVLHLSPSVVRHLELLTTYRGERRGSLLHAIDRTKTAGGARLLKQWIQFPLVDQGQIEARLDQVEFWRSNGAGLKAVRETLASMGDLERRLGKVSAPNYNARDLQALAQSLLSGLGVTPFCPPGQLDEACLAVAERLAKRIETEIVDEPPIAVRQGGLFRRGVNPALDELIVLSDDANRLLLELEAREREATGIPSLKIRFNHVFGYYLEVTKTHVSKVPTRYQRKQTLANAERYTTEELSHLEEKLLSAHARRAELEYELLCDLRSQVLRSAQDLLALARAWNELDVLSALAWLSLEQRYCRPEFAASGIELEASRHPVVEQEVQSDFVPNSVHLRAGQCLLLTGPNMAGKSTLMRQVAVAVIMAQLGSFVPAARARLGLFSSLFTRIGASDYLAEGLSTFMVEMTEAAEILAEANQHSLVLLDEIGRGTSTYDGLSLAQAILEHLVRNNRPTMLFATHYHELTTLAVQWPEVINAHMAIHENRGEITFLHTLTPGPANKSYGIQVARLAGVPRPVIQRAAALLQQLESGFLPRGEQLSLTLQGAKDSVREVDYEPDPELAAMVDELKKLAIQQLTPLEALNQIAKWQRSLS